jgi:hypothetical protein
MHANTKSGREYMCCATMSLGSWCAGVEHRYGGRQRRWRSCGFVPMNRRRMSVGTWPRDQRGRVTSRDGWHLGHARAQGRDRADHVADAIEYWRDTCPGRGGRACGALLTTVLVDAPQNHPAAGFAKFGPQNSTMWFRWDRSWDVAALRKVRWGEATLCGVCGHHIKILGVGPFCPGLSG